MESRHLQISPLLFTFLYISVLESHAFLTSVNGLKAIQARQQQHNEEIIISGTWERLTLGRKTKHDLTVAAASFSSFIGDEACALLWKVEQLINAQVGSDFLRERRRPWDCAAALDD